MPFDSVPLAIGNGAVHKDEVMRVANNIYTQDTGGINLPHHFKVTATSPASGSVDIAPGGITIVNPYASGESYVGRAYGQTTISSGLTTPGYHMIIARVIDPDYGPWQPSGTPGQPNTSVADGPYFQPFVVPGVGENVTEASSVVPYAAEPLALIKNPAGATTITDAMITPLRRLARPRSTFDYDVQQQTTTNYVTTTETAWHDWPSNSKNVVVPPWATHAYCSIDFGFKVMGALDVNMRVALGSLTPGNPTVIDYNGAPGTGAGFVEVLHHRTYAKFDVRTLQGKTVSLRAQAQRHPSFATINTGDIWSENTQQITFDVRFKEELV